MRNPGRTLQLAVGAALAVSLVAGSACSRIVDGILGPARRLNVPIVGRGSSAGGSSKAAEKIVRRAIAAYGGQKKWTNLEGLEARMVWKEYTGRRVDENPALVQLKTGSPPQIRIHFEKLDHVYGLSDQAAWVTIRDEPDRNPEFVAQARYTCTVLAFLLSLPFNLTDPGVVLQGAETKIFAGTIYDVVTVGFTGGGHPWPDDTMQLWFRQGDSRLDRCFFLSTAKESGFGPPPNYLLIQWRNHSMEAGIPMARTWSYNRAEPDGTMKERLFDIEVESVLTKRSFLPVLFREPRVAPPPMRRGPLTPGRSPTTPPITPTP